jgi:hypothetical protein
MSEIDGGPVRTEGIITPEVLKQETRPLLIFGIGPVVDTVSKQKPEDVKATVGQETVPFWSHDLAFAASILHSLGDADAIYPMGGRTGGADYRSESALIAEKVHGFGAKPDVIRLEEESYDTPTNVINFLNLYAPKGVKPEDFTVDVLAAAFHLNRVRVLMKLFAVPVKHAYMAEEVIRFYARGYSEPQDWDNSALDQVDSILQVNGNTSFYESRKGLEQRTYNDRLLHDNFWVREMLEYPSRILFPAADIQDDTRLREIVRIAMAVHGEELADYGFDVENDTPEQLREKMRKKPWPFIDPAEKEQIVAGWKKENLTTGWPSKISEKLDRLLAYEPEQK